MAEMAAAESGCDMSEAELLAMLRGIDADKIKARTEQELEDKYGDSLTKVKAEPASGGGGGSGGGGDDSSGRSGADDSLLAAVASAELSSTDAFLKSAPEDHTGSKSDLNQYWYSSFSIQKLVEEVRNECSPGQPMRVCFVSTPSLFFSLSLEERRPHCTVLDFDKQWESDPGFHFYDFNHPEALCESLHHRFDMVVIDPPFVQEACWRAYATSAKLLLAPGGKVLLTTILENAELLEQLLGVKPNVFRPSIPNLVYQYHIFTSYESTGLSVVNPEVGEL